jgi:Xaa-Pro aminopeptidase
MNSRAGLRCNARVKRLRKQIHEQGCDTVIVESPVNIFYLTGVKVTRGILVVKPRSIRFFVDGRYFEACRKTSPFPVGKIGDVGAYLEGVESIGFDGERTTYSEYRAWRKKAPVKAISLASLRMVKDEEEIASLRKSSAILKRGFNHFRKKLRVGMTEQEALLELEVFCRKAGASAFSFDPIIAFGKGSSSPHYQTGNVKLKKNDTVLLDGGVMWGHYASDRTRCFAFGKASVKYGEILKVCRRAHDAAVKVCRAGVAVAELNSATNQVMEEMGYADKYIHSLGHGVGLEIHEPPFLGAEKTQKLILEEGMVITIEPGIYIEGFGGVRYENMILVKKNGCEIL